VGRRPVVGLRGDDEDVAVQAHLLAVVLANVRVVPVEAGIGELEPVREALAYGHRLLRLVRPVVAVLDSDPVPVDGGLEIAFVDDVDHELGPLAHFQRRAWDRGVVGEHANRPASELLRDRSDPELELVAVRELDDLGLADFGQANGFGGEILSSHEQALLLGPGFDPL